MADFSMNGIKIQSHSHFYAIPPALLCRVHGMDCCYILHEACHAPSQGAPVRRQTPGTSMVKEWAETDTPHCCMCGTPEG